MAKRRKAPAPSGLTLDLHAPGMTPMHRAGLGGLAATLHALDRRLKRGRVREEHIPRVSGGPTPDAAPWDVSETAVTLHWGDPAHAGEYFKRLFAFAFQITEGLIDLPGTYRDAQSRAVRAELQHGLTLTFLQFGPHRKLAAARAEFLDPTGDGTAPLRLDPRPCSGYLHQDFHEKLTDARAALSVKPLDAPSAFNPGAVQRHEAVTGSKIRRPAGEVLCTAFTAAGCLSLPVSYGTGVLLVPDVTDLTRFARIRPRLTPTSPAGCRIAGPADGALQAVIRIRAKGLGRKLSGGSADDRGPGFAGVHAMRLRPTQWNEKQKSRVDALFVPTFEPGDGPGSDAALATFDRALRHLSRKVRVSVKTESAGRGANARKAVRAEAYFTDSLVRPLIADNLAAGRRWYAGFSRLMRGRNDRGRPLHELVAFERQGLQSLLLDPGSPMANSREMAFISAFHRAMHTERIKIYIDLMGEAALKRRQPATKAVFNRWGRMNERIRLKLSNAKTAVDVRAAVCDVLCPYGRFNKVLQTDANVSAEDEKARTALGYVLELVTRRDDWELLRDLALLALASYRNPQGAATPLPSDELDAVETHAPPNTAG